MDGILPPDKRDGYYDLNTEAVGKFFMTTCGQNPFCGSAFNGSDPYSVLVELFDGLANKNLSCLEKLEISKNVDAQEMFSRVE